MSSAASASHSRTSLLTVSGPCSLVKLSRSPCPAGDDAVRDTACVDSHSASHRRRRGIASTPSRRRGIAATPASRRGLTTTPRPRPVEIRTPHPYKALRPEVVRHARELEPLQRQLTRLQRVTTDTREHDLKRVRSVRTTSQLGGRHHHFQHLEITAARRQHLALS